MRQKSHTLTREYRDGSTIFRQGDPCKGAFVILDGKVVLSTGTPVGRKVCVCCARKGAVVGLAEAVGGDCYQTTATTATKVRVHFIPTEDILSMMADDPQTGLRVLNMLVGDVGQLYARIRSMAYGNADIHSR